MKKLIFGLLAVTVAIAGSAFTNAKKSSTNANGTLYTSGYLVQTSNDVWTHVPTADINDGTCETADNRPCKYLISDEIPTQGSYTFTEVSSTYAADLTLQPDGNFIYVLPE